MKQCNKCGVELTDKNWSLPNRKKQTYICKECKNASSRKYRYTHGGESMSKNKACSQFLGVHIAERVLSHVFKNVKRMHLHNKGYDVICNRDFMIDIKSACRSIQIKYNDKWIFHIKRNTIADYFLLLAFDDRDNLNPEHIWLIPGKDVNNNVTIGISESTLDKWDHYRIDKMKEIISCCNTLRS